MKKEVTKHDLNIARAIACFRQAAWEKPNITKDDLIQTAYHYGADDNILGIEWDEAEKLFFSDPAIGVRA